MPSSTVRQSFKEKATPLVYRAHHIQLGMDGGKPEEHAPAIGVKVRRALAHQIGQIEQAVRADGRLLDLHIHKLVRVYAHQLRGFHFRCAEVVAEPFQRQSRRLHHAHHMPRAGYGTAKGMYTALRVDRQVIGMRKYHAGGTDRGKGAPVGYHTRTDGCRGVVARAAYDQRGFG